MQLLMYILYILISCNFLAGDIFYVNNSHQDCIGLSNCVEDNGTGDIETPFCCIQNAIKKIETWDGCDFSAYTDCIDWGSQCDNENIVCTDEQTMEDCPYTCGI